VRSRQRIAQGNDRTVPYLALLLLASPVAAFVVYWTGDGWRSVWSTIATALLLFIVFEAANRVLLNRAIRRDMHDELIEALGLATSIDAAGIERVARFKDIDWRDFFQQQKGDVTLVARTLNSWSHDNADDVISALGGSHLTLMVAEPNADPLPSRDGTDYYVGTTATETVELYRTKMTDLGREGQLSIRRVKSSFALSVYRRGGRMWLVFSPLDPNDHRTNPPAILCWKTDSRESLFQWTEKQILELQDYTPSSDGNHDQS